MDAHSVVDDWETAPFDGGFAELEELASRGFSGAVEADGNWLFLRDGEPLAVVADLETNPRPSDIDTFEAATGTRYEAPAPSVATVAAMLALKGDVRGEYYTDDTPLEAVHDTLSGGGFTGYVELSENVLSGDYYFVYIDGEVEYAGFVGSSQVLTGEAAETKAKGEIGIYAVTAVSLPRPDLPEPVTETAGGESESASSEEKPDEASADEPVAEDEDSASADTPDGGATAEPEPDDAGSEQEESAGERTDPADEPATQRAEAPAADQDGDADEDAVDTAQVSPGSPRSGSGGDEPLAERPAGGATQSRDETGGDLDAVTTRTVPSLDPENTGAAESVPETPTPQPRSTSTASSTEAKSNRGSASRSQTHGSAARAEKIREEYESRIESHESQIESYESRIDELESEMASSDSRIEDLEAELESVKSERDELKDRLESSDRSHAEISLTRSEALSQTSLFVRARDRGEATLEDAHGGGSDRETVAENLRIEYHTEFDDDSAAVDGEPFESWLRSSEAYAFVEWLVTDLFFEIRSTGAVEGLRQLYDALPKIDRVGFEDTIAVGDGTDGRETAFDIVARNKKGNPLVVVAFDRQRDPTRTDAIESFVTDTSDVCEEFDSLAGAVAITSSYFESDARAAVEEATSSSLLSRSKHRSYVNLSRTSGYHLCLVEFRDDSFNLTHPEL